MTIVGIVLLILGGGVFALLFTGATPEALKPTLESLPLPLWAWLVIAAVGAILIYLNRRPND
jgi:hypothetical protein